MPKLVKKPVLPKGRPKSGRVWKSPKQRYSTMKADKPLKSSWAVKMKQRMEVKVMKARDKEMKDEKIRMIEEKKRRREENLKRREENAKKAEVVQVIKNSAKIKRMSKKQLRSIQKR